MRPLRPRSNRCLFTLSALSLTGSAHAQQAPTPTRVVNVLNRVEVELPPAAGQAASSRVVNADENLAQGARVVTRRDSAVTLRHGELGALHLAELTELVVSAGPDARVATLERGALRATVTGAALAIETPGGTVAMTRGEYRIHIDSSHATRVAVYRGRATVSAAHREAVIPEGTATRIDGARPAEPAFPPVALPHAPVWTRPFPPRTLALGNAPDLEARYAVPPTQRHPPTRWVQTLARDERFEELVSEHTLGSHELRMRALRLGPGVYFARVASVDGERFESIPSAAQRFEVAAPRVIPSGPGRRAEVWMPEGLTCRIDGETTLSPGVAFPLRPARAHELVCALTTSPRDTLRIPIPAEQSGELAHEVSLLGTWTPEGGAATLAIRLRDGTGQGYPYANLAVTAGAGVVIDPVREESERGLYRVDLRWPENTPLALDFTVNNVVRFSERYDAARPR